MDISETRKINKSLELSERALHEISALDKFMLAEMMSGEEGDSNEELGGEDDLDDATGNDSGDIIEDFLDDVIELIAAEYEESSAIDAVEDAVSSLVDDGSIDDIPTSLDDDDVKAQWIFNSLPKIKERLHTFGLEFDETDLQHYETFTNQG